MARFADSAQVAFDVGNEHRHTDARELLGQNLQCDGFTSTRRAGYATVSIGEPGKESEVNVPRLGDDKWLGHGEKMLAHDCPHQSI
jgi:hypothetical protein